jgi:hypothetical protein
MASEKRYFAKVVLEIFVPDNDVYIPEADGTYTINRHSKDNAEWVAQNVIDRASENWDRVNGGDVIAVADNDNQEELNELFS